MPRISKWPLCVRKSTAGLAACAAPTLNGRCLAAWRRSWRALCGDTYGHHENQTEQCSKYVLQCFRSIANPNAYTVPSNAPTYT